MQARLAALGSLVLLGCALPACGGGSSENASPATDAGSGSVDTGTPGDSSAGPDVAQVTDSAHVTDSAAHPDSQVSADSGADTDAPVSSEGGAGYGNDGPVGYTTMSLPVTNGGSSFTVNLWIPTSSGTHPVVSFSPGLVQASAPYALYGTRLASWGFVVLMRDDPGLLTSGDTVAADLSYTVGTWLPAQNVANGSPLFGKADLSHVGLAGHSRGGQATLLAAEGGLHGMVQAWVGLDPIDTAFVAGTAPSTNLPSIGIPTTYIGAGVPTNCAPTNDNYQVLYAVSPSPSIAITVVNASHTQFEMGSIGGVCTPMGTANSQMVLDEAVRYLTAFFARELLGDSSVGAQFQGAGAPADEAAGVIQLVSK
jgi:hypothetical protein